MGMGQVGKFSLNSKSNSVPILVVLKSFSGASHEVSPNFALDLLLNFSIDLYWLPKSSRELTRAKMASPKIKLGPAVGRAAAHE